MFPTLWVVRDISRYQTERIETFITVYERYNVMI
jgi:hypothetical protein